MAAPFVLFGPSHVITLAVIAAAAALLCRLIRARRRIADPTWIARALAVVLLADIVVGGWWEWGHLHITWVDLLPLDLCDFAVFVAAWALVSRRQGAYELLFFWACTGTLLAMVTPDLSRNFPDPSFVLYFALHGLVVTAAVALTWGFGMRPRRGAAWRALLWTNVYAACVAAADIALDANFMYLRRKPRAETLVSWFGPWPVYIAVAEGVALGLFVVLERLARRAPLPSER